MSRRRISWSAALVDLKADRAPRAQIREEPMRSRLEWLRSCPDLTAWRGLSGTRHVFAIYHHMDGGIPVPCVAMAVRREADGQATRLGIEAIESHEDLMRLVMEATPQVITELHVHRTSADATARDVIVNDLPVGAA